MMIMFYRYVVFYKRKEEAAWLKRDVRVPPVPSTNLHKLLITNLSGNNNQTFYEPNI